jgi:hypothetical protein
MNWYVFAKTAWDNWLDVGASFGSWMIAVAIWSLAAAIRNFSVTVTHNRRGGDDGGGEELDPPTLVKEPAPAAKEKGLFS